jgi:hypothetical protein
MCYNFSKTFVNEGGRGIPLKQKNNSYKILYLLLLPGLVFSFIAPWIPHLVESGYSQSLYRWIIRPYSLITGLFPFSLAELILVCTVLFGTYKVIYAVRFLMNNTRKTFHACQKAIPGLVVFLVIIYVCFNMMWGLNYNRMSFAELSGISVEPASVDDLAELALHLTLWANELREFVDEDERGIMTLSSGKRDMFARADLGYRQAAEIYPVLGGKFGMPKGVILSRYWSYTGIGGVYFPFTAEANVNTHMPHFVLPFATTHEMAHQRGIAREDEANYIAYLTCVMHPDLDFQYSGVALALKNTMNALYQYNPQLWTEVRAQYSDGVDRDFRDWREYWTRFDGPIQQASTNVNDAYLKANRQADGVQSYGRMVDLLIAEYKANKFNDR